MQLQVEDLAGTERFGRQLGRLLFAGAVVALTGQLGAGKTQLVRAISEGLDVDDVRTVTSPTYVLIQEYCGRLPIYHFDAYRLPGSQAFLDLGPHEYFAGPGVSLVEWAEKVVDCLPTAYLQVALAITGPSRRSITITAHGQQYNDLLDKLTKACPEVSREPRE